MTNEQRRMWGAVEEGDWVLLLSEPLQLGTLVYGHQHWDNRQHWDSHIWVNPCHAWRCRRRSSRPIWWAISFCIPLSILRQQSPLLARMLVAEALKQEK